MKSKKDEQFYENLINTMIRKDKVWCAHLETSIPGFPDTLVEGDRAAHIEYKVGDLNMRLIDSFEPAQLRVHRDLHKSGAFVITALVDPKMDEVRVFESGEMLDEATVLLDVRYKDFLYVHHTTVRSFVDSIVCYAKGEINRERVLCR